MRTCPRCSGRIGARDVDPASGLARCPLCATTVQAADLSSASAPAGRKPPPPGRIRAQLSGLEGEVELLPAGFEGPQLAVLGVAVGLLLFATAWALSLARGPAWAPLLSAPAWAMAVALGSSVPALVGERTLIRLGRGGLELRRNSALGERALSVTYGELHSVSPYPSEVGLERAPRCWGVGLARAFSGGLHADHHVCLRWRDGEAHVGEQLRPDELRWLLELLNEAARRR